MDQTEYDKRYKAYFNAALGKQIKAWRKYRNFTQQKLALEALTTAKHISNIENGKLSIHALTLNKLIQALNIDANHFHDTIHEEATRKMVQEE